MATRENRVGFWHESEAAGRRWEQRMANLLRASMSSYNEPFHACSSYGHVFRREFLVCLIAILETFWYVLIWGRGWGWGWRNDREWRQWPLVLVLVWWLYPVKIKSLDFVVCRTCQVWKINGLKWCQIVLRLIRLKDFLFNFVVF